MNEDTQPNEIDGPKRFETWKVVAIASALVAGYFVMTPSHKPSSPPAVVQVDDQAQAKEADKLSVDQTTMVEAKKAYKPKSIRENLARAQAVMAGFKEKPGEEMVDRMDRMNKYVLEATKEDVKYPK